MAIAALVVWMCTAAHRAIPAGDQQRCCPHGRFDPPSLVRAKSEPLPGMRAAGEFAHPALAVIGLGFWLGYVLSRDRPGRPGALLFTPRLLILHGLGAALTLLLTALIAARA